MEFNFNKTLKILVVFSSIWSALIGCWLWIYPAISLSGRFGAAPLLIPVIISLMAMWSIFKSKLTILTVAIFLFLMFWLSAFSIGLLYTPALISLVLALTVAIIERRLSERKISQ